MTFHSSDGAFLPREQLARGGRPGPEEMAVRVWRYRQLRTMGYEERDAIRIARDRNISLNDARRLSENGCSSRMAALILL